MKTSIFKHILGALVAVLITLGSCKDAPLPTPNPDKEEASELTQKVNDFIQFVMEDIYLWYAELPDIDIRYETDSKEYFDKLLYKDDKWSFITDDIVALENSFEGVETTFGYSLAFGRFSDTKDIFAVVEFVYPNTPASEAGFQRGDFIVLLNEENITDDNYTDLIYASSLSVHKGTLSESGEEISVNPTPVSMTARTLNLDPVIITNVIEQDGHKIGYLLYAQYISNFNGSLDNAFQYFKDQQITDLVIDLRYNPGGGIDAAQYLCSSVAPANTVSNEETLVTFQWNDKYQSYWEYKKITDQLEVNFTKSASVKLGLDKMHILTGPGTASASELTITGLKPYMEITTVGDTTYGKYAASNTFKPEYFLKDDNGNGYYDTTADYEDFDNWGIQPIILRFANAEGVTDFKDGFAPDILVDDNLTDGIPLGDKNEVLLKTAIEDITGTQILAKKKARIPDNFKIFDRGFSKFDNNKRILLLDNPEMENITKQRFQ
ncbi:C-terminal processing protease CtpA/Prc, contains a PDZ domain [Mariniphaga anaerophila]|uniref:C-terminal processing protease CtpA/Prc, contains a PDZ domain n=1 Tax=Mariniphaga anaerophila TaxID=1484053 RepID=A0A1M4XNI7_9BACT|nr:S41 family peptidase [Mariniphaga anaerophila]SHE94782.1 C-terminal processing protease CtpA/Prc, contains a PDZ domain [Mariniphaga anaerophila]